VNLSRRAPRIAARAAVALAAAACGVLASSTPALAQPSSSSSSFNDLTAQTRADWMGRVPDGTSLAGMSIPGTHDTLAIEPGLWGPFFETQENQGVSAATLTAQLNAGIRAIDIRVRVDNGAFVIHHTDVYENANFDDVLTRAQAFLAAHPTELILMHLHGECDADTTEGGSGSSSVGHCADVPSNITAADRIGVFQSYLARYPGLFYAPTVTGTGTAAMPTLGQARGHIVLGDFTGPVGEIYAGWGLTSLTDSSWSSRIENNWTECNLATKFGEAQAVMAAANAATSGQDMYTSYLSANCTPFGASPADMAGGYGGGAGENQRLLDYVNAGGVSRTGVVLMDYPGYAAISALIDLNPGADFSGVITSGIAGKCLDGSGTTADINTCDGGSAQVWTPEPDGTLRVNGLCLDVSGAATAKGTKVDLWTCNGGTNQQWTATESGALVGTQSGLCLDDPNSTTTDLTQLQIWTCNGTSAQVWTLP
jgi:hypothetical protein